MVENAYTIETRERLNEATRKLKTKIDHYRDIVPLTQGGNRKVFESPRRLGRSGSGRKLDYSNRSSAGSFAGMSTGEADSLQALGY